MSTQMEDTSIPQWKRELILRRKCHLAKSTVFSNGTNTNNGIVSNASLGSGCFVGDKGIQGGQSGDYVSVTSAEAPIPRQSDSNAPCDRSRCDLAMVEERLCGATPADADSDSSEELQYGPGIVNKLKCKYLSLALRESRKSRPSVLPLRRATSLDDLLDDDSEVQSVPNDTKASQRPNRAVSRGNESLKRARSVETLLRCDRKPASAQPVTEVGSRESFNEDVVIDERPMPAPRNDLQIKSMPSLQTNKPRRPAPLLADTERPPPDTVRSALRIFESSMRRARPLKPVGEVALKVATYKHIIAAKKPVVLPKPLPQVDNIATVKPTKAPIKIQPAPVVYGFGSNLGLKPPTSPKNSKLIRTPPVSPKKPVIKNHQDSTPKDDRIPSPRNLNISPIIFRSPSPSSPILLSPTGNEALQSPQPVIQQSTFPVVNGNAVNGSPTRQVGVIRPMEPADSDKQKAVELEKNLKNARDSESNNQQNIVSSWGPKRTWHQQTENTVVFNFRNRKDVPDYIENDGLVLKTRRDRPKINESGFILLSDFQSPNSTSDWENEDDEDDVIGGGGGDVTSDHHRGGHHQQQNHHQSPPRCEVVFEGAYVIINGKSSLAGNTGRVQPRAKLHIHFDDASTSTYEYPSEASLLDETPVVPTTPIVTNTATSPTLIGSTSLASYTPSKAVISPAFELGVTRSSPDGAPSPVAPSSPVRGTTGTTTGAPVLSETTTTTSDATLQNSENCTNGGAPLIEEEDQHLRPAPDDQTVSWSQEKYTTDLLF